MKVQRIHDDLYMSLGLHVRAHHPKGADRQAVLHQKARNDGMIAALARLQDVGIRRIQREIRPPVLQGDARAVHHDARAEAHIVGLDEGNHVALAVGAAEVYRTALRGDGMAPHLRAVRHLTGAPGPAVWVQKPVPVDLHLCRIRHPVQRVGKSHFDSLQLAMADLCRFHPGKIKFLQDVQGHQSDNALAVGRDLADLTAPVADADRVHPPRLEACQVFIAKKAAVLSAFRVDFPGDLAPVKALGPALTDGLQRRGMVRQANQIPGRQAVPCRCKGPKPGLKRRSLQVFPVFPDRPVPHQCQIRCAGISVPGILHRRGQILRERQPSETADHLRPGLRRTGDRHRRPAVRRHSPIPVQPFRKDPFGADAQGSGAAAVEAEQTPVLFRPDQRKAVRADPVGRRLDDREGGRRGDRGIGGIAALPEHREPRSRGKRARAVHHAAPCIDRKTLRGVFLAKRVKGRFPRRCRVHHPDLLQVLQAYLPHPSGLFPCFRLCSVCLLKQALGFPHDKQEVFLLNGSSMKNTFINLRTLIPYPLFPVKPLKSPFCFAVIGIVPV